MSYFHTLYNAIYPNDLHLKHELWYFIIKKRIAQSVIAYIESSDNNDIFLCDIGWWYGYDDMLIAELMKRHCPEKKLHITVIDPTIDFYNKVHKLNNSDIVQQQHITYIEESLLTMDISEHREKYDIIICSEVIEHLLSNEQEVFFAQFNRMLKPQWLIALTCPNGSSLIKQIAWLWTRKQKNYTLFDAEFHYRYSHIGVPTLFQVIWLFVRKWFAVHHIAPSALISAFKNTRLMRIVNSILLCIPFLSLFFSTTNVYIAKKENDLDETKRYNNAF